MKIVHVIGRLVAEGAEIFVCNLCKRLTPDHEIQLWVLGGADDSEFQTRMLKELKDSSIRVIFIGKRQKRDRWRSLIRIRHLIQEERPDVLNTHLEYVGALVSLAALFLDVRQIQTIHSIAIGSRLLLQLLAARAVHFVAISKILMEHYGCELHWPPSRFTLILNGTDLSEFPHKCRSLKPVTRFLSVGRLEEPKDFASLIEAARIVKEQGNHAFLVNIYGQGSLLQPLRSLIARHGLEDWVHLPGQSNAIPEIMLESEIYVVSSRWEGLSIALIEAMSSGMPLIATRVGGNPEVVEDGVNGFLVEKENPESIASAMVSFLENPELIETFSMAQRDRRESFNIKVCAGKYAALYETGSSQTSMQTNSYPLGRD